MCQCIRVTIDGKSTENSYMNYHLPATAPNSWMRCLCSPAKEPESSVRSYKRPKAEFKVEITLDLHSSGVYKPYSTWTIMLLCDCWMWSNKQRSATFPMTPNSQKNKQKKFLNSLPQNCIQMYNRLVSSVKSKEMVFGGLRPVKHSDKFDQVY